MEKPGADGGELPLDRLISAARRGRAEEVKALLEQVPGDLLGQENGAGWTAVHAACWEGHTEVIRLLASAGADLERKALIHFNDGKLAVTPMDLASYCEQEEVMEYLNRVHRIQIPPRGEGADFDWQEGREEANNSPPSSQSPGRGIENEDERERGNMDMRNHDKIRRLLRAAHDGNMQEVKSLCEELGPEVLHGEIPSPILPACRAGANLEVVRYLVEEHGFSVHAQEEEGMHTPAFALACRFGDVDVVKYLDEHGVDKLQPDNAGHTPMAMACYFGCQEVVEYLHTVAEMDLTAIPDNGMDAMMAACLGNELDMVKYLDAQGVDVNGSNRACSWLMQVCYKGHLEILKWFHEVKGVQLGMVNRKGQTLLAAANHDGRVEIVKYLIEKGVDVNRDNGDGTRALHLACHQGSVEVVHCLVSNGAKINPLDAEGRTPFFVACQSNHLDVAKILASRGADKEKADEEGATPLTSAVKSNHVQIVKFLCEEGVDVDTPGHEGHCPLFMACFHGYNQMVRLLVEAGAHIDTSSSDKDPIAASIQRNNFEFVRVLVDKLADLGRLKNELQPSSHWLVKSCYRGRMDLVKYFIDEMQFSTACTDGEGTTPLIAACYHNHMEIVVYLLDHGADVHQWRQLGDGTKFDAISAACNDGDVELLLYLEKRGVDLANPLRRGDWMVQAAWCNNLSVVKFFHDERGFELNVPDDNGQTPIVAACSSGAVPVIDYLHEVGGVSLEAPDTKGKKNSNVGGKDTDNTCPMTIACLYGRVDAVKYLHEHGIPLIDHPKSARWLVQVCYHGHLDVLKYFVEHKADLCRPDEAGTTPFRAACCENQTECVAYLRENGVDINEQAGKEGSLGTHIACRHGKLEAVKQLLEMGCDPDDKDKQGNTCCHIAATVGHVDVLKLLHEKGADMTAGTAKEAQWSPYHSACLYGKLDCMRYLFENGFGDPPEGQYPTLQMAYRHSYLNIVKFLVEEVEPSLLHEKKLMTLLQQEASHGSQEGREACHKWLKDARFTAVKRKNREGKSKGKKEEELSDAALAEKKRQSEAAMAALLGELDGEKKLQQKKKKGKKKKKKSKGKRAEAVAEGEDESGGRDRVGATAKKVEVAKVDAMPAEGNDGGGAPKTQEQEQDVQQGLQGQQERQAQLQEAAEEAQRREESDSMKAQEADKRLQEAMNANREEGLRVAIEWAKEQATEHGYSVKKLKLLKAAKRQLKSLAAPAAPPSPPQAQEPAPAPAPVLAPAPKPAPKSGPWAPAPAPAQSSASAFKRPKTVGRLTLDRADVLGEGSLGTRVYRGKHADGRDVAVKVMLRSVVPQHRARREMRLMQTLAESGGRGGQHVIQYRCLEEEEGPQGRVLLGMELCEGGSLYDVIVVKQQQIPMQHQLRIARELCEAVAFLHEQGIVHRDVRPKNILFKQAVGYEGTLKLTDFGLSKDLESRDVDQSFSTTTTQAGTEIGSFGYYAPEVYRMERPTPKVDIFSTGCCVFYTLSHGGRPFADAKQPFNKYLVQTNILTGKSDLSPIARTHPEALELVRAMLDMEARARPSMGQALQYPLFWSDEARFQFLCAVGREADVGANDASARAVLPPSLLAAAGVDAICWRNTISPAIFEHYTSGAYRRDYDTSATTHLLRFLRNCGAGVAAAAGRLDSAGVLPIGTWLAELHPDFASYADAFVNYGYSDTDMLLDEREEDLRAAFEESDESGSGLGMVKKPHQRRILRAHTKLLKERGGGGGR
eukprot:g261.t1